MAVAVDNTGAFASGTGVTSLTITSFAVGAGSNRLLFAGASQWKASDTVPSATFNTSENFTVHDAATIAESPGTRRATILKLVAPSNATANIVFSWGGGTVDEAVVGATSWTGVDQTTPLGTAVKNTNASASSSTVSVPNTSGDAVHDVISNDGGGSVNGTPTQTQRWRVLAATNTTQGAGQSAAGTGTNISLGWSGLTPGVIAHIGVPINQAGAPPPTGKVPWPFFNRRAA